MHQVFANGHCAVAMVRDQEGLNVMGDTLYKRAHTQATLPTWEAFHAGIFPEKERRLGAFRARYLEASARTIFPNVFIGLRLALPRGPRKTEIWSYTYYDKDSPGEVISDRRIFMGQKDNPAGVLEQDDMDNWRQMTDSSLSHIGRMYPHNLSMAVGHGTEHAQLPGIVTERLYAESNQRNYYLRWQEFMNAESWTDIGIDPITAKFEGTATMKG